MPTSKKRSLPLGDISVNFVSAIIRTLQELGSNPDLILSKYGLKQTFLDTPDARISIPRFMRIGHDAIQLANTPHLGLLMGKHIHAGDLGLAGFTAMTAGNLGSALENLIEFELLSSQNSRGKSKYYFDVEKQDSDHPETEKRNNGRSVCQFYSISPYNDFNYFVIDSTMSSWFHFGCWLTGKENWLHHIEIEHDMDAYKDKYEQLFKCPVYYGMQRNALVLKRNLHQTKSIYSNPGHHQALRQLCEQEKKNLESGKSIGDRVVDLISEELSGATPSIQEIAEKMGMAGWTLRRRLEQENTNFKSILNETRHALALSYVRDTDHNYSEIAFLLGFSSPSAFQRAFKRWTNLSPGEYRSLKD